MTSTGNTSHTTGSKVVAALEAAWKQIQRSTPDVPDVVIITGSGSIEGKWGHSWASRWIEGKPGDEQTAETQPRTEIFIAGERLACGATLTLQTMIHEAAHALAHARGIKDTSRGGRYHNGQFRKLAEELGMIYPEADPSVIGFSGMVLREDTIKKYAAAIKRLDAAIRIFLPGMGTDAGTTGTGTTGTTTVIAPPKRKRRTVGKVSTLTLLVCQCEEVRRIRVAPLTIKMGPISCGLCGAEFAEAV